ncbi:MAG: amidophosphoribosyltransferase [Verrucomicrobiota bacterium]|nr:amidophosphoribosyltransferase [Verrucomicrobiota bacterium]
MSDKLKEECGICGVFGVKNAVLPTYYGLHSLQHRGQESAGIVASDGKSVRSSKGMGLVNDVFNSEKLKKLPGHIAVGHVRYSTSGANKPQNIQPLVVDYVRGLLAVAHNGNLVNARKLRSRLEQEGSIFQTGTDSEVIVHLMAKPKHIPDGETNLSCCLRELKGAYSFLFMTRDSMTAVCDPNNFRPLSIARLDEGYVVASETCAFDILGAEYIRDVKPGEMVTFTDEGMTSFFFVPPEERKPKHCIFELIYFSRPDSNIFGENVHKFRSNLGRVLSQEHPVDADMVVAVPDSGNSAAIGYAEGAKTPYQRGFVRNHYIGRTFIQPNQEERDLSVKMKLNVIKEQVKNKKVVVVDDSLIRGTTSQSRLACLKEVGVSEVHMRISCPPCRYPCFYGVDFPSQKELIAAQHSVDEIKDVIGADSLGYISLEGLLSCTSNPENWCHACFSGKYTVPIEDGMSDKYGMDCDYGE